jgi:hypothetical protein
MFQDNRSVDLMTLEGWTDRLSKDVGKKKKITTARCSINQKRTVLERAKRLHYSSPGTKQQTRQFRQLWAGTPTEAVSSPRGSAQ